MGGRGGGPLEGVGTKTHNIQYRKQNTEYRMQNTSAAKLMYIILPMYLFFVWRLDLMILMGENIFRGPLEEVGPENRDFFGPKLALALLVPRHINKRYINI